MKALPAGEVNFGVLIPGGTTGRLLYNGLMADSENQSAAPFDRALLRQRRDRAAAKWPAHDFLVREAAERLVDRLDDIKRQFPMALDLGCHGGEISAALNNRGGIETLIETDLSPAMAARARDRQTADGPTCYGLAADEEALPFGEEKFDLILSCLSLHWVNDLPGTLAQIRHCLKPDGLFLAAFLGGETLNELRQAWIEAETAEEGGASPHVSPFVDIRDAGALLQRAGLALPVVDSDTLTVSYESAFNLMAELRGMGETNALNNRRRTPTRRATAMRAAEIYAQRFKEPDGRLPATFQILTVTAWAPDAGQPQPLAPGSAEQDLATALKSEG